MGEKLNIWILNIGEPLLVEEGVRLLRYGKLSKYLAQAGHNVTWWTSGFSHAPKKHIVESTKVIQYNPNLRLIALQGLGYQKNVSFRRIWHLQDYAKKFSVYAEGEPAPDVILVSIPVLEAADAVVDYVNKKNVPFIVDVRDCWPLEFELLMPKFLRPLGAILFKGWYKMINRSCQQADAILGVSQEFLDYGLSFSGHSARANDKVMPIGYKIEPPDEKKVLGAKAWLPNLKLAEGDFSICFFGQIGRYFDLATVIEAARLLKDLPIKFILCGTGSSLDKFKAMAHDLDNVIFTGWINDAQMQAVMRSSHIGLAPYKKDALMSMPNKLFEYMAGALPILTTTKGALTNQVVSSQAGLYYEADSPSQLKDNILKIYNNRQLQAQMSQNALKLFNENYSLDFLLPQFENLIARVAKAGHTKKPS